jgi:MoxR-like ATPase
MEYIMPKTNYSTETERSEILRQMRNKFDCDVISGKELNSYVENAGIPFPYFIVRERKVSRGRFSIVDNFNTITELRDGSQENGSDGTSDSISQAAMQKNVVPINSKKLNISVDSFVPEKNSTYVPFGFFSDLKEIVKSKIFYPIYITGLSGNGKTMMVEQVCASLNRELIRVNVTKRTDETDLIGSYELIDGNTVRREGPVIIAMRRGAVLLLDEVDLGTEDLLCLQPILEGKSFYDKKTGEIVHPAPGFNVFATANTKGKGSDDGRFIGTNFLNEAFLERFAITVEQQYPPAATERKILEKNFAEHGISDDNFIERLITWADVIRKAFDDNSCDEVISTRRLIHIVKAYAIFKDRLKAIELCLARFDSDTKNAFLDFYTKIDSQAVAPEVQSTTQENVTNV